MNEHLAPVFEIVLPALEDAGIPYYIYGGAAAAGIAGEFVRHNPDVDVFVFDRDYERAIELVSSLTSLNWEPKDAEEQRGRRKRDWFVAGRHRDIFSVVAVYPMDGGRVLFKFGRDFIPNSPLTSEERRIGNYPFVSPSADFLKELLIAKSNEPKLLRQRIEKLKIDAKVLMSESEYQEFCDRLDALKN